MKKIFALVLAVGLVAGPLGLSSHAGKPTPLVVAKDAAGDWGQNLDPTISPLGAAQGQDVIEASIGMADPKAANFVIKVTSLPPVGGVPEFTRYTWEMAVDNELVMLDGKFTDYSRGVCDPPPPAGSGGCPPTRDPGGQPFFVKGDCVDTNGLKSCTEKGIVKATFDAVSGTITIPVPLKLLGAKPGSKIVGAQIIFGHITAQPAVRGSYSGFPLDQMLVAKTFVVPRR